MKWNSRLCYGSGSEIVAGTVCLDVGDRVEMWGKSSSHRMAEHGHYPSDSGNILKTS